MADKQPGTPRRAPRTRKPSAGSGGRGRATPPASQSSRFRDRLRRDPFLFALCLGFLAFTTWALAVSWRLLGDPSLLALAVISVLPAFYLFYLRDSSPA